MNELGELALVISLLLALYGTIVPVLGAKKGDPVLIRSAESSIYAAAILVTLSSIALLNAFFANDFSVEYVASYSNRDLNWFYTMSAFWGGQKGSLLLWAQLLAVLGSIVVWQNRNKNRDVMPYVTSILSGTMILFMALLVFATPPFELIFPPEDGHGLNPLLQNPGMVIHPPTMYVGFVGFTIPFAFAMASLITGKLGDVWIRTTRKWTIFAWFFLTMGNLLGAWWAYRVLGWGGYWAWDPVENASFMPWLTGTAYLHSVMIQERRDMLKVWNMVLIVLTFSLTIFGAFITRSGIIQSVHSFGQTTTGYYFLAFLAVILLSSTYLITTRLGSLKSRNELDSIFSRESSFLFNNLFLVGIAFATFWGTMFPAISEFITGKKITVGAPFFNQVNVPLGLALVVLIGVCPLISWGRATKANFNKNFKKPFIVMLIGGLLLFPLGYMHIKSWITFTLAIFVIATIVIEYTTAVKARIARTRESLTLALFRVVTRNSRRYGGYIIHIGFILMVIGIAGTSYNKEKEAELKIGETISIADYKLTLRDIREEQPVPTKVELYATLDITKDGKPFKRATPRKDFYKTSNQPVSRVYNISGIKEDLYIILAGLSHDGESATFRIHVNPLVQWLWIGGWIIAIGTLIVMLPSKKRVT